VLEQARLPGRRRQREQFKAWLARGQSDDPADGPFRAFRAAVRKARAQGEMHALRVIQAAMPSHWQAAAWFLERSNPKRWGWVDRLKATLQGGTSAGASKIQIVYEEDWRQVGADDRRAITHGKSALIVNGKGYSGSSLLDL
jgi:hypothetical protein